MSSNPYRGKPDYNFWRQSVAGTPPFALDPFTGTPLFKIAMSDKVATAGSCFAQHISRALSRSGFDYLVTEAAPRGMAEAEAHERNFGVFSARYGNIYTSRQLKQTFERALGRFTPKLNVWQRPDGRYVDPFRPQIEAKGFETPEAVQAARAEHLEAVLRMMKELDILVFTLGLTESWFDRADGATLPVAPGVSGGDWDESLYGFHNLSLREVVDETVAAIDLLREVNPKARVLLTVSPVPLIATYRDQHVLLSNTYSKSVLRVAAEEIAAARDAVMYFPSFEIITSLSAGNRNYHDDLRSVTQLGVDQVMRVFFRHLVEGHDEAAHAPIVAANVKGEISKLRKIVCDEEAVDSAR